MNIADAPALVEQFIKLGVDSKSIVSDGSNTDYRMWGQMAGFGMIDLSERSLEYWRAKLNKGGSA